MKWIPVFRPLLEAEELEAAGQSLQAGWLGMGADLAEFEGMLAELLEIQTSQRKLAVVSIGHAALISRYYWHARAGGKKVAA